MISRDAKKNWPRRVLRGGAACLFIAAGVWHFVDSGLYVRIVPPILPGALWLVWISGVAEVAGGVGLLIRPLRLAASCGLIALLVAVFPANLYMAIWPERFADLHLPPWGLWARLPLQGLLIAWVWFVRK